VEMVPVESPEAAFDNVYQEFARRYPKQSYIGKHSKRDLAQLFIGEYEYVSAYTDIKEDVDVDDTEKVLIPSSTYYTEDVYIINGKTTVTYTVCPDSDTENLYIRRRKTGAYASSLIGIDPVFREELTSIAKRYIAHETLKNHI